VTRSHPVTDDTVTPEAKVMAVGGRLMSNAGCREARKAAIETLTPWHAPLGRDDGGYLRRCVDVQCSASSPVVASTDHVATVDHRPGCAVAEFMRRLDALAESVRPVAAGAPPVTSGSA
jgi:hypothetical protein